MQTRYTIPIPSSVAFARGPKEQFQLSGDLFTVGTDPRPVVVFCQGTGANVMLESSAVVQGILAAGFACFAYYYWDVGDSVPSPDRYNFANNDPEHFQQAVTFAWELECVIQFLDTLKGTVIADAPVMLMGQSRGATQVCMYSMCLGKEGFSSPDKVQGILANCPTAGGGSLTTERVGQMSTTFIRFGIIPTVIYFANNDTSYAPPIFREWCKYAGAARKDLYFRQPPNDHGHSWYAQEVPYWSEHLKLLWEGKPIPVDPWGGP